MQHTIIPTRISRRESNPPFDCLCVLIERMLKHNPDKTDQQIKDALYNSYLYVVPLSAIGQIRKALQAGDDRPSVGFADETQAEWMKWAEKHGIEGVVLH